MNVSYYKMINCLIQHKDILDFIADNKSRHLIKVLKEYVIPVDDEYFHTPDNKELGVIMSVPHIKLNPIIKQLYERVVKYFEVHTLEIKECVQEVSIFIPLDEEKPLKKRRVSEQPFSYSRCVRIKMPFIPRVGDEIYFETLEHDHFFHHGYVYNVEHKIIGTKQMINIYAHPFKNFYFHWKKLEEEYKNKILWDKYKEREMREEQMKNKKHS